MPQYEVTTTVSFTCVHTFEADGEETAMEQAYNLTSDLLANQIRIGLDVDQEAVQYITRDEDYKLHT
jgi:hypothetical protein